MLPAGNRRRGGHSPFAMRNSGQPVRESPTVAAQQSSPDVKHVFAHCDRRSAIGDRYGNSLRSTLAEARG